MTPNPSPSPDPAQGQDADVESIAGLVGLIRTLPFDGDVPAPPQQIDAALRAHDVHAASSSDSWRLPPDASLAQIAGYVCVWLLLDGGLFLGSWWVLLSGANLLIKGVAVLGFLAGAYCVLCSVAVVIGLITWLVRTV